MIKIINHFNWSEFFVVKDCIQYKVFLEYTDNTYQESYCLGWDESSAREDFNLRMRAGVYTSLVRPDGFTEFKTVKAFKIRLPYVGEE
jgi:hypothetical protein